MVRGFDGLGDDQRRSGNVSRTKGCVSMEREGTCCQDRRVPCLASAWDTVASRRIVTDDSRPRFNARMYLPICAYPSREPSHARCGIKKKAMLANSIALTTRPQCSLARSNKGRKAVSHHIRILCLLSNRKPILSFRIIRPHHMW